MYFTLLLVALAFVFGLLSLFWHKSTAHMAGNLVFSMIFGCWASWRIWAEHHPVTMLFPELFTDEHIAQAMDAPWWFVATALLIVVLLIWAMIDHARNDRKTH